MFDFKYAEFIVPAFVITAIAFAGMLWTSLSHARRWSRCVGSDARRSAGACAWRNTNACAGCYTHAWSDARVYLGYGVQRF